MSDDGWRDHYEEYWDEDGPRDDCAHEEYDRMQQRENSRFWRAVDWLSAFASRVRYQLRRKATATTDEELPF